MTTRLMLLALCACNQVFGLEETGLRDGAGIDAPFSCPPLGTPPAFNRSLYQLPGRGCRELTLSPSTGRMTGLCYPGTATGTSFIGEGPIDGELTPILTAVPPQSFFAPRLTPDGQRLFVIKYDSSLTSEQEYTRTGSGWMLTNPAPFRNGPISTFAEGNRVLIQRTAGWEELVESNGTWSFERTHTHDQLGVSSMSQVNMSLDGLRLVFTGAPIGGYEGAPYYADRDSVTDLFRTAVPHEGVPLTFNLTFMTKDCGRLYLHGLDRMFYVQQ